MGQHKGMTEGVGAQGVHVHRSGTRWVVRAHAGATRFEGQTSEPWGSDDGSLGIVEEADDLLSALVLADLLSAEIEPGPRPPRSAEIVDEAERLRVAVRQLEHALAARVTVEQAIGVIAERGQVGVREAFEMLRRVARSQGTKVHDLSRSVVQSVTDDSVRLPADLPTRSP